MTRTLSYGLREMPNVKAAWGARLIFPNDVVGDRTSSFGVTGDDKDELMTWLRTKAPQPSDSEFVNAVRTFTTPTDDHVFTVFEDDEGIIQASAQGSHGYLYMAAWLKKHVIQEDERRYYLVTVDPKGLVQASEIEGPVEHGEHVSVQNGGIDSNVERFEAARDALGDIMPDDDEFIE
jgi:hypothetical protein